MSRAQGRGNPQRTQIDADERGEWEGENPQRDADEGVSGGKGSAETRRSTQMKG